MTELSTSVLWQDAGVVEARSCGESLFFLPSFFASLRLVLTIPFEFEYRVGSPFILAPNLNLLLLTNYSRLCPGTLNPLSMT